MTSLFGATETVAQIPTPKPVTIEMEVRLLLPFVSNIWFTLDTESIHCNFVLRSTSGCHRKCESNRGTSHREELQSEINSYGEL